MNPFASTWLRQGDVALKRNALPEPWEDGLNGGFCILLAKENAEYDVLIPCIMNGWYLSDPLRLHRFRCFKVTRVTTQQKLKLTAV